MAQQVLFVLWKRKQGRPLSAGRRALEGERFYQQFKREASDRWELDTGDVAYWLGQAAVTDEVVRLAVEER